MIKYTSIFLLFAIFSCGNEIQNVEDSKSTKQFQEDQINDKNLQELNVDDYLSSYLLIGQKEALAKNKITSLNILGHDSYLLNGKGQIVKSWNISNNYDEYVYDKNGLLQKIFYKQHTTQKSYLEQLFKYGKKDLLESIVVNHFDDSSKIKKTEQIKDEKELNKRKSPFQRGKEFQPFKIDTTAKLILNYRTDLVFCCGNKMEGKNKLTYFYNDNDLIDSLIIYQIDSTKTMKFVYQYK